jgi:hypothetical protein
MPGASRVPTSNVKHTLSVLLVAMTAAMVATAGATALVVELAGRPAWWSGWVAAQIIGVLAMLLSLALVVPGIVAGPQWAAYGYLAGALIRGMTALAGCVVAVWIFRTPAAPTLLIVVPTYFALVATEAVVLGRAFWPRR